jgi:hypothetical protein
MSHLDLHQQARAAIQSGKLPSRVPDRTWGGPGVGAACPICGLPVSRQEMELEMEFARDRFHVHLKCYAAWEFERQAQ